MGKMQNLHPGENMSDPTKVRCAGTRRVVTTLLLLTLAQLLASVPAPGQQSYVPRYNLFAGYTFLDSPHVSLFENGFHFQAGVNPKTWLALGFDYSVSGGSLTLTPDLLTPYWQQQLTGLLEELGALGHPCRVHRGGYRGTVSFPYTNLCRWAATGVSPFPEGDPLRSALRWSDP